MCAWRDPTCWLANRNAVIKIRKKVRNVINIISPANMYIVTGWSGFVCFYFFFLSPFFFFFLLFLILFLHSRRRSLLLLLLLLKVPGHVNLVAWINPKKRGGESESQNTFLGFAQWGLENSRTSYVNSVQALSGLMVNRLQGLLPLSPGLLYIAVPRPVGHSIDFQELECVVSHFVSKKHFSSVLLVFVSVNTIVNQCICLCNC